MITSILYVNLIGDHEYPHFLTPGYALVNHPDIEFFVVEKRNLYAIDLLSKFYYFLSTSTHIFSPSVLSSIHPSRSVRRKV